MSYDMIDRFLRNNLGDDDYAEYSAALDSLCTPQPKEAAQCTNSDSWNCKYCTKNQTCEAINDHRNFGEPKEQEKNTTCGEPVELNKFGIQKLLKQSGFDNATPEETAAFISGIRHREAEMLDTTPYVATPRPQRKPLTDEQRLAIQEKQKFPPMCDPYIYWFFKGVDACEAAHGIKE